MDIIDSCTADMVLLAIRGKRVTQQSVARQVGISQSTWVRRMKGERSFRVSELVQICKMLGVSPGELIDEAVERAA